jgi:tetratricopeptide (TPR) repeat protein
MDPTSRRTASGFARTSLALTLVAALVACASSESERDPSDPGPAPAAGDATPAPPAGDERPGSTPAELAIERIHAGDFAAAVDILDAHLIEADLAHAREQLGAERPEDALLALERVLDRAARHPEALLLQGRASLALAEKSIAARGDGLLIESALQDALAAYRHTPACVESLFGASHAAWLLGEADEALHLARQGMARLEDEPLDAGFGLVPQRVLAEAAWSAYGQARAREASVADQRTLFAEAEEALSSCLGRTPDDPWVWSTLADLYESAGMSSDARGILLRGLERLPRSSELLARLARVTRGLEGAEGAIATFQGYGDKHPDVPEAPWYEGMARYERALALVQERKSAAEGFRAAEALFRHCRTLAPSYESSCKAHEVICRAGIGWSAYQAGELERAEEAFRSMEEIQPRGLEWQVEGQLLSGVQGLEFVVGAWNERKDNERAGEISAFLHTYQPEVAKWANNAGLFLRDAAVELELGGRRLCQAARGEVADEASLAVLREMAGVGAAEIGTDTERERLARASEARTERAQALMQRSSAAYRDAVQLAPEDVSVLNDAALIFVYYLGSDLGWAEELLLRCVELGARQLEDPALDARQAYALKTAWGDAHQNLGVLYANHEGDAARALEWFAKSVEIGPEERPLLFQVWMPYLRGERLPTDEERPALSEIWAEPCDLNK